LTKEELDRLFIWTGDYLEISIESNLIILFHYPISIWRECHKNSWCIVGHSHNTYFPSTKKCKDQGKILDVGWDSFNKPLSYFEVKKIMDTKIYKEKDHHNKETT
jgi:calcineurin-like phosphoesterase family protein